MLLEQLQQGMALLPFETSAISASPLIDYIRLIAKWNQKHNLTAVSDPSGMVIKHLLDSLSLLPYLPPGSVLDAGTGAGLPGIPLALALPARKFVLVDASQKRVAFLKEVKRKLALNNVTAIHARLEQLQGPQCEVIVSRAFSALDKMVGATRHLLAEEGCWLAMKGRYPDAEIEDLPEDIELFAVTKLDVPGLDAERHLITMKQKPANRF